MRVVLDGNTIDSREALHETLARELHFPAWYGRNLDALFDSLTDIREDTEICLCHLAALEAALGTYAGRLVRVLRRAAEENPRIRLELTEDSAASDTERSGA